MTKIFLTPITPAVLSTDPAARTGSFYYNTDDQNFRFYDGNLWQPFGTGGGGGGSTSGTNIIIDGGTASSTYVLDIGNVLAALDGGSAQ
jgi:hypothetical protein